MLEIPRRKRPVTRLIAIRRLPSVKMLRGGVLSDYSALGKRILRGEDQSPWPGSGLKYLSNFPSSPLCSSASAGVWSFLRVTFGQVPEKVLLSSSHFSSPLSV